MVAPGSGDPEPAVVPDALAMDRPCDDPLAAAESLASRCLAKILYSLSVFIPRKGSSHGRIH